MRKMLKSLKGPFDNIEFLACGGVNPENMKDYFRNGASIVAIGSQIFNLDWITQKDYVLVEKSARKFVELVKLYSR